jgi:predicted naringenin-chalcone synthase
MEQEQLLVAASPRPNVLPRSASGLRLALADFRLGNPGGAFAQDFLLDYMAYLMALACVAGNGTSGDDAFETVHDSLRHRVRRYGIPPGIISKRHVCLLPKSIPTNGDGFSLVPELLRDLKEQPMGPRLDQRMRAFDEVVLGYLRDIYQHEQEAPADIVHVSCSGYLAPSPVQKLASERHWNNTVLTHSYHMGCYGAMPAIRTAFGILSLAQGLGTVKKHRVDVVHTEPLSLHFDVTSTALDNIITMSLFGDGFIRYSAFPLDELRARRLRGLQPLAMHDTLLPDSVDEMIWNLGPHRFDMYLGRHVPRRIRDGILPFIIALCAKAGIDFESERDELVFAVHPGGPKILTEVQNRLGLRADQLKSSYEVLRDYGNMSSASVPHIWHRIVEDESIAPGTRVVSFAFGPGLTASGVVFEKA